MSDKKTQLLERLDAKIDSLAGMIDRINDGDIGFSDAGDWLHNCGNSIVSALEDAHDYISGGGDE